ncbi:bifunctional glutamine-synthetase adenylyltransferase/deadenyltransferase [Parafrankia colletiae]|uniref:Bifunctional glutamine synthetase adenylyltransferase/adenylyl-removing enzyme n=1 Tax=Parafrankia colletiae TaxID=573497 RepID=A0A1S1QMY6_9ACTN|nr:bifunctional [glutamine synthetase] adenylyltransferase/[glutamine synthetase]-adenylyl-L-tyrosine phosphorylase [Parafrankia colletiae]MCK9898882.1 bifunctional [glutamine synthetase] adenylyltransferase/[glutamine synthetase]-adenylyl-L-tyrosine phosphorylase [Frankia sp. Cpl3]OHV35067.1 bifunctional glutamine-synthetase adenylyltransferase/deadenyltransferase [Parafrankia colletiae]
MTARRATVAAQLARLGFSDVERVAATMRRIGLLPAAGETAAGETAAREAAAREAAAGGGSAAGFPVSAIVGELAAAADPDLALRSLERLLAAQPAGEGDRVLAALAGSPGLRRRLIAVLGASSALGDHLAVHPADWAVLASDTALAGPPDAAAARADLLHAVGADPAAAQPRAGGDGPEVLDALRLAYRRAQLVLAARDLTGAVSLDDATAELADLAGAALDAALAVARAGLGPVETPVRLAIIGMGKCGGRELNYVSDVDVLFIAEPGTDDGLDAALRTATRLAEGVVRACGLTTPAGELFQVDVNLRPEGRHGALVRTLDSHRVYYRRWARTWEFQALLKARPIAGDRELGERFAAMIAPMVWTAASRPDFVVDIRAMRRRVERSLSRSEADRNLKLGPGGLRDVEFAVQLLQLVHGRTDGKLQVASTLDALDGLARGGYVGRRDAAGLADAYRFLRTAEHRLQLQRLRRVHTLPRDPAELRWLARCMGLPGAAELADEHRRVARSVRSLHEKLFYQPLLEAVARLSAEEMRLTPQEAADRLAALGFADPARSLRHIEALTNGVSRTATIQRHLLPAMLPAFADAPEPDAGLLAYRQVSEALGRTPWYLRLLRDSAGAADRLARVLATSRYVADLMTRAPESVRLLRTEDELRPVPREALARTLLAVAHRNPDALDAVGRARAVHRVELVRVACADLLGLLDVGAVGRALSDAAAATIEAALFVARRQVLGSEPEEHREPGEHREAGEADGGLLRLGVVAMGRLGGAELSYGSDADVLFVHEPGPGLDEVEAARLAAAIIGELHRLLALPGPDPPLRLDAALRPEGRGGPLSRTLDAYAAYYGRWSAGWEAQALLRARPVAGDRELGGRLCRLVDRVRYPDHLPDGAIAEVLRLRGRMEQERIPRGVDHGLHVKFGPGGLTDVEWTLQVLQLRHAARLPALRTTATREGLRAAAHAGLLTPGELAALDAAWTLASRIRNGIMLTSGQAGDLLPASRPGLERVARALGYPAEKVEALPDDYRRAAARARSVADDVLNHERAG